MEEDQPHAGKYINNMNTEPNNDIILPKELTMGTFTLEQIGGIAVLMTIPTMEPEAVTGWASNTRFLELINELIESGIAVPTDLDDGSMSLEIDLTNNKS